MRLALALVAVLVASPAAAEQLLTEVSGHHSMAYLDATVHPKISWGFNYAAGTGAGAQVSESLVGVVQRIAINPIPWIGSSYIDLYYQTPGDIDDQIPRAAHTFSFTSFHFSHGIGHQQIYAGDFFTSGTYGTASSNSSTPIVVTSHYTPPNGGNSLYGTGLRFSAVEFTLQFVQPNPDQRYEVDWTARFFAVPEPSSFTLFGLCFGLLHIRVQTIRRRRS